MKRYVRKGTKNRPSILDGLTFRHEATRAYVLNRLKKTNNDERARARARRVKVLPEGCQLYVVEPPNLGGMLRDYYIGSFCIGYAKKLGREDVEWEFYPLRSRHGNGPLVVGNELVLNKFLGLWASSELVW
jgi:hypothetical protein